MGAFHGALGRRVNQSLASTEDVVIDYVAFMRERFPAASVYVESNPRFLERVAQTHGVADPSDILDLLEAQGGLVRCLFMVRDPRGYARSLKNRWRETGRDPWALDPGITLKKNFDRVYGIPPGAPAPKGFDRIGASWLLRNRFLGRLANDDRCFFIRFEDLFDAAVSDDKFVERIQEIHDHLQLPAYGWVDDLLVLRREPRNATSGAEQLSEEELHRLREICGEEAARFGYQL